MAIATIGLLNLSATAQIFITNGLVAYYPFNGNANDATGNQNDGTAINGVSYVPSPLGSAASFNGSSQYIALPNTISNYQDLSVTFWVNTSDSNPNGFPYGEFLISRDIFGYALDWNICLGNGSKIDFVTDGDELLTPQDLASNSWVQVSCVADSVNQVKILFVNGQPVASASWLPNPFANNMVPIFIGASSVETGLHAFFTGEMTDVRFYNRALGTNEVQAIYNAEGGQCTPPPSGIISWWSAEGNTLDNVNANGGIPIGALGYTNGEVGQAFSLDGATSYVLIPNAASLNPTGSFSMECWIYPTQDGDQKILSKWGDQGADDENRSYALSTVSGLGLQFAFSDLANQENFAFQDFTVNNVLMLNAWNHVAATYDIVTGIRCIYVNGIKVGSHTNAPVAAYASITPVTIGAWLRGSDDVENYFPGLIDEVSLYGRALSGSEIQAIYSAGSAGKCPDNCTPPSAGLVGWWTGDETAMDVLNANNGTLLGGTTYAPGKVGQAFQFGAVGDQVSVPTGGFPIGTNDRTIECWVYINSFIPGEGADFAFYGTSESDGGSYIVGAYSDQRLFFSQWGSGIFGPVLTTNQWYHVAVTSEGTNTTLYLDGTNVASGYVPFSTPAGTQLFIGGIYYQFATYQMLGLIDEVSIYNRALSSNEIAAIYDAGSGGKCNSHPFLPPPRTATATAELAGTNGIGLDIVVGVDIVDGGAGYTNTPNVRFIGGGGNGAQASVVISNGIVVAIDITNSGSGYTNAPVVVIDPPFILNPVLGIASISILNFSNLLTGTNYQLQQFQSTTWINQSTGFKATNSFYTTMVSGAAGSGDYRLAQIPVPVQATAFAQVVNGFVVNVSVINPGSGYITVPAVAFIASAGSNATAVASINNGRVTSIEVTSAGIHYGRSVTVQIDPPPVTAISPAVTSGVVIHSSSLAPYDNYQIQFKPEINAVWSNLSGGLFSPPAATNTQYIFLTNNVGIFRLQYVP